MTVAHILSSAATIHAARAYTPPGKTVADLFQLHNIRRATVGLMLSAMIGDDRLIRFPQYDAGPFSNRYRNELYMLGVVFDDDVAGEALYRNIEAENQQPPSLNPREKRM
jgi:hypothetical protein